MNKPILTNIVFNLSSNKNVAKIIAKNLPAQYGRIFLQHFSDGEIHVKSFSKDCISKLKKANIKDIVVTNTIEKKLPKDIKILDISLLLLKELKNEY